MVTAVGQLDGAYLASVLRTAVRDATISSRRAEISRRDDGGSTQAVESEMADTSGCCYYLRSRTANLHVDHTFECQLMGHALVQSPTWHALFKSESFIGDKVDRAGVLRKALDNVHAVQNDLENLRMLEGGINQSKRHAFTHALGKMHSEKRAGGFDLPHDMERRCTSYFGSRADLEIADAGAVASKSVLLLLCTLPTFHHSLSSMFASANNPASLCVSHPSPLGL